LREKILLYNLVSAVAKVLVTTAEADWYASEVGFEAVVPVEETAIRRTARFGDAQNGARGGGRVVAVITRIFAVLCFRAVAAKDLETGVTFQTVRHGADQQEERQRGRSREEHFRNDGEEWERVRYSSRFDFFLPIE